MFGLAVGSEILSLYAGIDLADIDYIYLLLINMPGLYIANLDTWGSKTISTTEVFTEVNY